MKLEVVTPEENMGDVIGDLNKRRGQVEGMESSRSGARIVKAMVPLAEMFGYVTALRTITSGRATSSMVYSHHAQVSNSIAKAVLEEVKGRAAHSGFLRQTGVQLRQPLLFLGRYPPRRNLAFQIQSLGHVLVRRRFVAHRSREEIGRAHV